jgi:hypothetical protein
MSPTVSALPKRGELAVRSSDEGHVIAAFNPLALVCFTRTPTSAELATLSTMTNEAVDAGIRGGLLYIVARDDLVAGVDSRVRASLEAMTRRNADRSGSSAVVVLSTGFAASMVRSVLASLVMLSKSRKALQVFGGVREACEWLAIDHQVDAGELYRAVERATSHIARMRDTFRAPQGS